jgi:hypothetical protein
MLILLEVEVSDGAWSAGAGGADGESDGGVAVSVGDMGEGSAPMNPDGWIVEVVGGGLEGAALVPEFAGTDCVGGVAGGEGGGTGGDVPPEASGVGELVVVAGADVVGEGEVPDDASGVGVAVGTGMTSVWTAVGSVKKISQATTLGFSGAIS